MRNVNVVRIYHLYYTGVDLENKAGGAQVEEEDCNSA